MKRLLLIEMKENSKRIKVLWIKIQIWDSLETEQAKYCLANFQNILGTKIPAKWPEFRGPFADEKTERHCPNACANAEIKDHVSYYTQIGLITEIAGFSPKSTLPPLSFINWTPANKLHFPCILANRYNHVSMFQPMQSRIKMLTGTSQSLLEGKECLLLCFIFLHPEKLL